MYTRKNRIIGRKLTSHMPVKSSTLIRRGREGERAEWAVAPVDELDILSMRGASRARLIIIWDGISYRAISTKFSELRDFVGN